MTCCFTGHRPSKFTFGYNEEKPEFHAFKSVLRQMIVKAIGEGYTHFVSGGALGVDTWAAELVLELKTGFTNITLEIAVPCIGQGSNWPKQSQKRYDELLARADLVTNVTDNTYEDNPSSMLVRDIHMVNKSDLIIAAWDGTAGGTKHTHDYAKALGIKIWRLNPKTMDFTVAPRKTRPQNGVLECSSIGDPRFSAKFAIVTVFGVKSFIEEHYQLSKRFGDEPAPEKAWHAKGKEPTHFVVNGTVFPKELLSSWYKLLWVKYLDENPDLVQYAAQFDDFTDHFRGKSINCQADAIKQYVQKGRRDVMSECAELLRLMKDNHKVA